MREPERVILTNMCMIRDPQTGYILVQDRVNPDWSGVTFPGGHVEAGESFTQSVIREVREETGLTIRNPRLCGIKQWIMQSGVRYLVFFFRTGEFSGELISSSEGKMFWIDPAELTKYRLANEFADMYRVFADDSLQEYHLVEQPDGSWKTELF